MTKQRIMKAVLAVAALFLISLCIVVPRTKTYKVELGQPVPEQPQHYLIGWPFMRGFMHIDVDLVDSEHVGHYRGYATYFFYTYKLDIQVTDKTPPAIDLYDSPVYLAKGREYLPEDLAKSITDASGQVRSTLLWEKKEYEQISFDTNGTYTGMLRALDASGNLAKCDVTFIVDDPPMIIGAFDRHIERGTAFDPTDVLACDTNDGLLGDKLRVQTGGFNADKVGDYQVTYAVTDNNGLETTREVTLSVMEPADYRKQNDELRFTSEEMEQLCHWGYFDYEPLTGIDYYKTLALVEPTLIDLKRTFSDGSWTTGSGVIYRVTSDYMYFLSVEHVMEKMTQDCHITFFDGSEIVQDCQAVSSDTTNEAVMFAVPTSEIPADTMLAIKQVHYDPDIYKKLRVDDPVVAYATHWGGFSENKVAPANVRLLTASLPAFGWSNCLLETSRNVISGMSGTAVVDYKGNLVGLVSAVGPSTENELDWSDYHSKVDVVPELWDKMQNQLAQTGNAAA